MVNLLRSKFQGDQISKKLFVLIQVLLSKHQLMIYVFGAMWDINHKNLVTVVLKIHIDFKSLSMKIVTLP